MGLAISTPAMIYILGTPNSKRETGWIDAGKLDAIQVSAPTEVRIMRIHYGRLEDPEQNETPRWIVKGQDKKITAFFSALYSSGLRLSLGWREADVRVPLPWLFFLYQRRSGFRARPARSRPIPGQDRRRSSMA